MTEEITLFKEGIVASSEHSAQPKLKSLFHRKLTDRWYETEIEQRTVKAIDHVAQFIPEFSHAKVGGPPMFGAQQIPGDDPSLRAADVSFAGEHYARAEIVKASSALAVADAVIENLKEEGLIASCTLNETKGISEQFPITNALCLNEVTSLAEQLALERECPLAMARPIGKLIS